MLLIFSLDCDKLILYTITLIQSNIQYTIFKMISYINMLVQLVSNLNYGKLFKYLYTDIL